MTRDQKKRRTAIIKELSRLSRNGWRDARPCDYEPLEREIRNLTDQRENERLP